MPTRRPRFDAEGEKQGPNGIKGLAAVSLFVPALFHAPLIPAFLEMMATATIRQTVIRIPGR